VIGDYEKSLYESGFDRNDLSFWASTTEMSELKLHLNTQVVDIPVAEFAVRPQPLRNCNNALNLCQGEITLEYNAYPIYNESDGMPLPRTGLFSIESPKPRTTRYSVNPGALAFTTTDQGDPRLEEDVHLVIQLPPHGTVQKEEDLNPKPTGLEDARFPVTAEELRWTDMVLVKFTVAFEVEESLDQEVVEFFSDLFKRVERQLQGEQGMATVLILLLLLAGYFYLQRFKRG